MSNERIQGLQALLREQPANTFARYGLAMEYMKAGELPTAVDEFRAVIAEDEAYAYAYFHGGRALEQLGLNEEARAMYETGLAVSRRTGNGKAAGELQGALDLLPA